MAAYREHLPVARRGHAGEERELAHLIAGVYRHASSREQDPQIHSHTLLRTWRNGWTEPGAPSSPGRSTATRWPWVPSTGPSSHNGSRK
ncbi:relaxase domain-containing protein [Acidithiobacillus ferriphilus]|nr:relaxase domain-containing protein [Acidithiobacillus ferriphilus]